MRMLQEKLDPGQLELTKGRESDTKKEPSKEKTIEALSELDENNTKKESSKEKTNEIQSERKDIPKYNITKPYYTVWFNAWKYYNNEQIWAGLADAIITQISKQFGDEKDKFLLDLQRQRIGPEKVKTLIKSYESKTWKQNLKSHVKFYSVFAGITVATLSLDAIVKTNILGQLGILISIVGSAILAAYDKNKSKKEQVIAEAESILRELLDVPNYSKKLTTEQQVEQDLIKLFGIIKENSLKNQALKNEARLVIFIDDLDRCSPNRITEVLEALNMFISSEFENSFFVIGMDPEFVSAALEESYTNVIQRLSPVNKTIGMGWNFMNKFIQLPVILPRPDKKNLEIYIQSLLVDKREKHDKKIIRAIGPPINQLNPPETVPQPKIVAKAKFIEDQKAAIDKIDEAKDTYSDQDPKVQQIIIEASKEFPNNPREMKRFLNILRFYYFIREGRKAAGLSYSSLDQIKRWILLVMKWPHVAVWLQKGIMNKESDPIKDKLERLENNLVQNNTGNSTGNPLNGQTVQDDGILSWMKDENLSLFFQRENRIKAEQPEEALSAANETGLF